MSPTALVVPIVPASYCERQARAADPARLPTRALRDARVRPRSSGCGTPIAGSTGRRRCGSSSTANGSRSRAAEVIRHAGPWRGLEDVEFATLEWVCWFNEHRLLEPIGLQHPNGRVRGGVLQPLGCSRTRGGTHVTRSPENLRRFSLAGRLSCPPRRVRALASRAWPLTWSNPPSLAFTRMWAGPLRGHSLSGGGSVGRAARASRPARKPVFVRPLGALPGSRSMPITHVHASSGAIPNRRFTRVIGLIRRASG